MKGIPFLVGILLLALCPCQSKHARNATEAASSPKELTEQQVIEIAKAAVKQNDTWSDRATYEAKRRDDGTWSVVAWRITGYDDNGKPLFTPGGHRLILVDSSGKVIRYVRGA